VAGRSLAGNSIRVEPPAVLLVPLVVQLFAMRG